MPKALICQMMDLRRDLTAVLTFVAVHLEASTSKSLPVGSLESLLELSTLRIPVPTETRLPGLPIGVLHIFGVHSKLIGLELPPYSSKTVRALHAEMAASHDLEFSDSL